MISVVSLGSKFSGGGIVLREIVAAIEARSIQIETIEPTRAVSIFLQRLLQVIWIFFWPLRIINTPAQTVLVAHSLFLLSPFIFLLRKRNLFFLFQGEEYKALQSPMMAHAAHWLLKGGFKYFQCIPTNRYLLDVAQRMGGQTPPIKISLGPKREFFFHQEAHIDRKYVIVFAREGYNKGLVDALEVAQRIRQELTVKFVAPDESIAAKIRAQGFNCLVSVDPTHVCRQLREATALFLPSHYEGLSLPMLEALAVGTPVVTYSKGFPQYYSNLNNHVRFIEGRDAAIASASLIEVSKSQFYSAACNAFLDRTCFSFEGYCDEVANLLINSVGAR
ncbi:glycosyltransferase [Chitinimonas taiwanensis]|uniref:glycosyltransferase n=1 Tax=Chitinimonas taiwanensis TaxID=240412 RepID=UPI0035AE2987